VTGSGDSRGLPIAAKLNLALLGALAAALAWHLWPEWSGDPDLSHGFLVPAACLLLIYLCRRSDGAGSLGGGAATLLAAALGAAGLASLWAGGLLAASLDWESPIVDFALASSLALLGTAAAAAFADRRDPRVPFAWPTVAAALIWPLASPMPPGTYTRLTLALQLWVSAGVMRTLDLLGIAARREGNIIELARGTVGIEEACSGVRSLISCVFAGILFSAALVRRPWARVLLVALSAPLALSMNFARSLVLTLLVNSGVRVEGAVHDVAGYSVLVLTAAMLAGLAIALDRRAPAQAVTAAPSPPSPAGGRAPASQAVVSGALALAALSALFFAAETAAPAPPRGPAPDVLALLPAEAPGWSVATRTDLGIFSGTLRTDSMAERTYRRPGGGGGAEVTIYVAYWRPGQASVGLVGSHTPDACWPGAGWAPGEVADPKARLESGGRPLPGAEHRLFTSGGRARQVWFWHLYAGRPIDVGDTRSVRNLASIALRYGFRQSGEQYFIRVSSDRPWDELSREPFLAEFFARMRPLGLY
jgi:exosortase